jgi:hypothetical protein
MGTGQRLALINPRTLIIYLPSIINWALESNNTLRGQYHGVNAPFNWNIPSSLCTTTPGMTLVWSLVNYARRSWSLAIAACQYLGWTSDTSMQLTSKNEWRSVGGTKMSFDLTITSNVPPFSHNVATKQNTVASWILEMPMSQQKTMVFDTLLWLPPSNLWVCWT